MIGLMALPDAKSKCPILPKERLSDLPCGGDPELQWAVLRALEVLGHVVLVGGREGEGGELVVLRPQWLTRLVSSIVTTRHHFVRQVSQEMKRKDLFLFLTSLFRAFSITPTSFIFGKMKSNSPPISINNFTDS